ncbi:MAG TPA: hypothetical protein VL068_01490 [Microthrixaceae bacterium]|nr:hypothetical protein [Microthrixaceae bacterium]
MTVIGADPEALRDLSREFRRLTARLESSRTELDRHLRNTEWQGSDSLNFRRAWSLQHRVNLLRTVELCRVSAATLVKQADEQETASMEHSRGLPPGWPGGWPGITGPLLVPASGQGDVPRSITELDAGISITIASVLLGLGHDIRIEDFAGGRSLITVTSEVEAGAKGSVGTSVRVGSAEILGRSASVQAALGGVIRRSYEVDSADVWKVIAAIELQDAVDTLSRNASTIAGGAAFGAVAPIGRWLLGRAPKRATDLFDKIDPREHLPTPITTERLVQVAASGDVSLTSVPLFGPSATAAAGFAVRAGRLNGPNGSSSVFEVEGEVALELRASLLGESTWSPSTGSGSDALPVIRVQIPDEVDGSDGRAPMVITTTVSSGGTLHQRTSTVDLSTLVGTGLATGARLALDRMAAGDPTGAFSELSRIGITSGAVVTTEATFAGRDLSGTIGGESGEGLSLGADVVGGISRRVRTR